MNRWVIKERMMNDECWMMNEWMMNDECWMNKWMIDRFAKLKKQTDCVINR